MEKMRAIYIIKQFPQLSETYVKSEIEAVQDECEVLVIGLNYPDVPYKNHAPYHVLFDWDRIVEIIEEFKPHVLHTHWLYNIWKLEHFAQKTNTPYTIRAHSFDLLINPEEHYTSAVPLINDDLCLGVLTFPFGRPPLEKIGVRSDKLHDCYPVVHYNRFYDRSPNGEAVMNVGACNAKKKMEDFIELADMLPQMQFNLYPVGYDAPKIKKINETNRNPVNIGTPVQPEEMPREYKKHRWMVYTASHKMGTVGWPIALAEAQASGVGVCMANLRPDLREYVGEAGFLFDSISEAKEIISQPFPDELREIGFEHAKKSDVFEHKTILTNLWRNATQSDVARQKSLV
ncbi:MAG: glycosyltransferase [Coleofasciculaceae cyanobacterium]